MKLIGAFLILLTSCASGAGSQPTSGEPGNGKEEAPAVVPDVTGQSIRVEWRSLNPRHGTQRLGLVNESSPEARRLVRMTPLNLKPVDDQEMAALLAAFYESDFFKFSEKGNDADSYEMGDGHGVVSLVRGKEKRALVFRPTGGVKSEIPEIYRDLKLLIMNIYNRTLSFQLSTPQDPNKVFSQPVHKRRR